MTAAQASEERIWLDGKINGKSVRLVFDTGSSHSILFSRTADRLGLKVNPPSSDITLADDNIRHGETELCDLNVWSFSGKTTFQTLEIPTPAGVLEDGLFGWGHVRSNVIQIDAESLTLKQLTRVPPDAATWVRFPLMANHASLSLEVPGQIWSIGVDTGSSSGVTLMSAKWREWKAAHKNAPLTLSESYSPSGGSAVSEESWAKEFSLGGLTLTDVPVRQPSRLETANGQPILGLAALKRLDFIIDGTQGVAYLRPKRTPPPPYQHNRLGAEFVPRHSKSDELVAQVADGSPAQIATIRNGDVLLKVGDRDVTKWRTDPNYPRQRSCERPAGTKLDLTLKRDEEIIKISVVLRDILGP